MHTSTIEPSSSLLAFIRQSGRPKGPSSAMKLVEVILLALSSDIPAQLFACGLEYRAGYCGQQPCGQPYPGVGVGLPPPSPPCLSQYPMQCVPVPQQYGALNCICSGNSGIYQGGDYLYPPPLPPPPPPIPHLRWRRHISTTATAAPRATTKVSPGVRGRRLLLLPPDELGYRLARIHRLLPPARALPSSVLSTIQRQR